MMSKKGAKNTSADLKLMCQGPNQDDWFECMSKAVDSQTNSACALRRKTITRKEPGSSLCRWNLRGFRKTPRLEKSNQTLIKFLDRRTNPCECQVAEFRRSTDEKAPQPPHLPHAQHQCSACCTSTATRLTLMIAHILFGRLISLWVVTDILTWEGTGAQVQMSCWEKPGRPSRERCPYPCFQGQSKASEQIAGKRG